VISGLSNPEPLFPKGTALSEHAQLGMAPGEVSTGDHGGQVDLTETLVAPPITEGHHDRSVIVYGPTIVALGLTGYAKGAVCYCLQDAIPTRRGEREGVLATGAADLHVRGTTGHAKPGRTTLGVLTHGTAPGVDFLLMCWDIWPGWQIPLGGWSRRGTPERFLYTMDWYRGVKTYHTTAVGCRHGKPPGILLKLHRGPRVHMYANYNQLQILTN
jgi:hypothetical protein